VENFTIGKTLGPNDLSILVRDSDGRLVDPVCISYNIYFTKASIPTKPTIAYEYDLHQQQNMQGGPPLPAEGEQLVSVPQAMPCRASCGVYYVPITIPTTWTCGTYRLIWNLQQYPTSPITNPFQEFYVISIDPADTSFEAPSMLIGHNLTIASGHRPELLAKAIRYVRELLSDVNPDRNYHFRPPTPGRVVAGYNSRIGFIWVDSTILFNLDMAIGKLNTWNPRTITNYTLYNIPMDWEKCAAIGAASMCLSGESARWTADEFSYSLNGVSLDLQKSGQYMALANTYGQQFSEWAPLLTAIRPFAAGVRQARWIF
jgi:hypothetical protein